MDTDLIVKETDGHWIVWPVVLPHSIAIYGRVTLIDGEYVCGSPKCVNPDHVIPNESNPRVTIWATIWRDRRTEHYAY